jgi:ATP-dependent Clp protease protease subunit
LKKTWEFRNKAETSGVGELLIYGDIASASWYGDEVTAAQFKKDLDALGEIKTLNIYINSDGGDVFAAQAMYSMVKRHSAYKNVYIDGIAASAASFFAMVGDTIYMPANAMMMVHNPLAVLIGYYNAGDMRQMADALDKIRESIIPIYTQKSGLSADEVIELLDAETWLTADDAKTFGFIDEIEGEKQVAASLNSEFLTVNGQKFDIKNFKTLPKMDFKPPDEQKNENEPDAERLFLLQKTVALKSKKYKYQEVNK